MNTRQLLDLSDHATQMEVYAGKIDFCVSRITELVSVATYEEHPEQERAFYFWYVRDEIESFVEMQRDYIFDLLMPQIKQIQECLETMLAEEKPTSPLNGFAVMAATTRKAAEDGKITPEQAEKKARLFDFLGTCNIEDLSALYASGAFNEFMRSEISITIDELKEEGILTEEQAHITRYRLYENMTE